MKRLRELMSKFSEQRWWRSLPFLLALIVIIFLTWTIIQVMNYPYDGIIYIHPTGLIKELDTSGPANNKLLQGDVVQSISGIDWADFFGYEGRRGGDQVEFIVVRAGKETPVTVTLVDQSLADISISLAPIFIAFIFWVIGVGVLLFKPPAGEADLFFLWCQVSAATLVSGVASYLGPQWTTLVFATVLWFIGPLSVHFHMHFPQSFEFRVRKSVLACLYIIALIGITPYFFYGPVGFRSVPWYPLIISTSRLFLGLNLILVVVLLFVNYRQADVPGARAKIRLVALGGALAAIPLIALTVLPDALLQGPIIPYQGAFLWLGILPITYGFAIFRLHLIEIERHVNRGATYILVYSILGGCYLILYAFLQYVLPANLGTTPFINTVIVLILATIYFPLTRSIQKFVDRVFYGGWYDYRLGLLQITQNLEQINDLTVLARTVAQRLVDVLRLEESSVFLRDIDGEFSIIEVAFQGEVIDKPIRSYPVLARSSLTYLLRVGVIERKNLQKLLGSTSLTPEEVELLNSEQINLWVPVIGHGRVLGLLALGPKLGGDVFSGEDLDILRSIVVQLGPLIENILLLTRLKQHAEVLEKRVRERTAELHDAKERSEAILGSVGDGVLVTDLGGNIATVNAAFENQSGYSQSEIIGKKFEYLVDEVNDRTLLDEMEATLTIGQVWSGELVNRRKDGQFYDVLVTMAPICDQEGQTVGYVGSQRDITRQKELERMKDIFIADVSHELRTPTTNIGLYLDLLDDAPDEKRKQYMSVVKEQSQLLTKLVEDILDLSRLAKVRSKRLEFEELDFNLLVQQVVVAHKPLAHASGISLIFLPSLEKNCVWGDQEQVERLVSNLVTNAVRYTSDGSVEVSITKIDDQVCLEVSDTGIGMSDKDLEHIFERFYRGENVRQSRIPGTGLGLAIVKEIVDLHEGRIDVQSKSQVGSVFRIWLHAFESELLPVGQQ